MTIEINDKVLSVVAEYINAKNKANKADFPVISVGDIQEPKVRGNNIVCLANGEIKGLAKHTIPYTDLNLRKSGRPRKVKDTKENTEDE